ncbi:MAG: nucleotidyltransferase family protein, partial [Chloroflexota bacterium]
LRRKNSYFAFHLRRLLAIFEAAHIPTLVIKGAALALGAYGSLSLRQFEDIDLLVAPEQVHQALELAQAQGFVFTLPAQRSLTDLPEDEYHFQLQHPRWHISLELHWKVGWREFNAREFPLSFAELNAQARTLPLLDSSLRTPSLLHTLILLGIDSLKERGVPLGRLLDAALIARQPELDWDTLWSTAERIHALPETAALIGAAALLFDLPESPALRVVQQNAVARAAMRKILRDAQRERPPTMLEQLYLYWRLRPGWDERQHYARRLIADKQYRDYFAPRIGWDVLRSTASSLRVEAWPGGKRLTRALNPLFQRARWRWRKRW